MENEEARTVEAFFGEEEEPPWLWRRYFDPSKLDYVLVQPSNAYIQKENRDVRASRRREN